MKYNYKPSLKDLHTSLKVRSREYFLENSLHGVQYIVDPTRPKWERIAWLILTLSSIGATIGIIMIIWRKFQTEPTITGMDTDTTRLEVLFPQVYICYDWNQLNTTVLDQSETHMYKEMYDWFLESADLMQSFNSYKEKNNFREVFQEIAPNCDAVLDNCEFNTIKNSCGVMFKKELTAVGACCKYKSTKLLTIRDAPWELRFEALTYPLRLYIQPPISHGPERDERAMVTVNTALTVRFIPEVITSVSSIRYLMRHQRQCDFASERRHVYDCWLHCTIEQISDRCLCLPWFLKLNDREECSVEKYSCVKDTFLTMDPCDCLLPCEYVSYVPRNVKLNEAADRISSIRMLNWPRGMFKRETRFGYLDLLVSFGGIGGLFLGYSLITSIELGYYFSLRTYCGAVVDSSRKKHNIRTVHVIEVKAKPTQDIKPIYYQYVD